jgi:hypothetical protein
MLKRREKKYCEDRRTRDVNEERKKERKKEKRA